MRRVGRFTHGDPDVLPWDNGLAHPLPNRSERTHMRQVGHVISREYVKLGQPPCNRLEMLA